MESEKDYLSKHSLQSIKVLKGKQMKHIIILGLTQT